MLPAGYGYYNKFKNIVFVFYIKIIRKKGNFGSL